MASDNRLMAAEGRSFRVKAPEEGIEASSLRSAGSPQDETDSERIEEERTGGRKVTRVQMLLPASSVERLDALKDMTDASSYSEVIRNAIRVYEAFVRKEVQEGGSIFIKDKDGSVSQIRIF